MSALGCFALLNDLWCPENCLRTGIAAHGFLETSGEKPPCLHGQGRGSHSPNSPPRPDLTLAGCPNLTLAGQSPNSAHPDITLVTRPDLTLYPPKFNTRYPSRSNTRGSIPPHSRIFPLIPSQTDFTSAGQSPDSPPDRSYTGGSIPDSLYR